MRMGNKEEELILDLRKKIFSIYKEFMAGITKIDELGTAGSRLLVGFQQALDFIQRPPIDRTSELANKIILANETNRVKSYVEAGCRNPHDSFQNVSKLRSCRLGLLGHISEAKLILNELEELLGAATNAIQSTHQNSLPLSDPDLRDELDEHATYNDMVEMDLSNSQDIDVTCLASLMGIIYSMIKQDHLMQERIVSALTLKSSSRELESYCLMWSLHPFINDDIMHRAWRLVS